MIAFGCAVSSLETFSRLALPGIERVSEPDTVVITERGRNCIFRAYNDILAQAAVHQDLEALVLLHDDLEIVDPELNAKIRHRLEDPEVAVVGAIGARNVRSSGWWDGERPFGAYAMRVPDDFKSSEALEELLRGATYRGDWGGEGEEVDSVDGMIMVLSPWAVRNVRFDEDLGPGFHGYDGDFCFQVRAAGKKIVVERLETIHYHSAFILKDRQGWIESHMAFARKWGL